jgi:hypothetical protein
MHKTDYELIAEVIHDAQVEETKEDSEGVVDLSNGAIWNLMLKMAARLEEENPRFDAEIFFEACTPEIWK